MTGVIKRIVRDRGFGFVKADDGSEYFFHASALRGGLTFQLLEEGEVVRFEPEESPKGPRAGQVTPA